MTRTHLDDAHPARPVHVSHPGHLDMERGASPLSCKPKSQLGHFAAAASFLWIAEMPVVFRNSSNPSRGHAVATEERATKSTDKKASRQRQMEFIVLGSNRMQIPSTRGLYARRSKHQIKRSISLLMAPAMPSRRCWLRYSPAST